MSYGIMISVGLIISNFSTGLTGKKARINDILQYARQEDLDIEFKLIPINREDPFCQSQTNITEDQSRVEKGVSVLLRTLLSRSDIDIFHISTFPKYLIFPLLLETVRKPIIIGPNVCGKMLPEKLLYKESIIAKKRETPQMIRRWNIIGERLMKVKYRIPTLDFYKDYLFISFSEYMSDILNHRSVSSDNISVLPSGVPKDVFYPMNEIADSREGLRILFVGKPSPRKGLQVLIDAIREMDVDKKVCLYIAGVDNWPDHISGLDEGSKVVNFLGHIPRRDLANYYNKSDIYVLPSFHELESTSLIEALACGTPCIATDFPSNREIAKNGNTLFFEVGEPDDLAAAIHKYTMNKKEYDKAALQTSASYDIKHTAQKLVDVYKKLV